MVSVCDVVKFEPLPEFLLTERRLERIENAGFPTVILTGGARRKRNRA